MGAKYQIKEGSISSFFDEISKRVNICMIFHAEKPFLHDFMFDVSDDIKMCPCFDAKKSFLCK
jgi:hypothetical protein